MKKLTKNTVKTPKHKDDCVLQNRNFTVINNAMGQKLSDCHMKFCPCCGVKLK